MDATPKTMDEIERAAVEACLLRHDGNRARALKELAKSPDWLKSRIKAWNLPPGKPGRPKTD